MSEIPRGVRIAPSRAGSGWGQRVVAVFGLPIGGFQTTALPRIGELMTHLCAGLRLRCDLALFESQPEFEDQIAGLTKCLADFLNEAAALQS